MYVCFNKNIKKSQAINLSISQSLIQPANQTINQSASQSVNQSTNQLTEQSVSQPTNQLTNYYTNYLFYTFYSYKLFDSHAATPLPPSKLQAVAQGSWQIRVQWETRKYDLYIYNPKYIVLYHDIEDKHGNMVRTNRPYDNGLDDNHGGGNDNVDNY